MKTAKDGTLSSLTKWAGQHKKSAIAVILLCILICAGMVSAFLPNARDAAENNPLENLTAAEIAAAEVHLTPPDESYTLTETEIETLAELLQELVVFQQELPLPTATSGQSFQLTLTLSDGASRTISSDGSDTIFIYGLPYTCDYDSWEALNSFANRVVASSLPENAEEFLNTFYTTNDNGRYEALQFEKEELGEEEALENYAASFDSLMTPELCSELLANSIPLDYDTLYAENPLHVTGVTLTGDTPGGEDGQFQFTVTATDGAGATNVSFNGTITIDPKTGLVSAFAENHSFFGNFHKI